VVGGGGGRGGRGGVERGGEGKVWGGRMGIRGNKGHRCGREWEKGGRFVGVLGD